MSRAAASVAALQGRSWRAFAARQGDVGGCAYSQTIYSMMLVPENMEKVMKALVATDETQGARKSDFTHCVDGELVWMLDPCPNSKRNPDGPCACGRSFSGMSSHGYTTTALVREIPWLTEGNYAAAMRASFEANGWCACCRTRPVPILIRELIERAGAFPAGAVVERRLNDLHERATVDSARE